MGVGEAVGALPDLILPSPNTKSINLKTGRKTKRIIFINNIARNTGAAAIKVKINVGCKKAAQMFEPLSYLLGFGSTTTLSDEYVEFPWVLRAV